jgi:hypothetical protein
MHHDTFNADFYVTAATVIPILYLALTLQGQTYEQILTRVKASSSTRSWKDGLVLISLFIVGTLIVFYAILGELLAIIAIYERKPPTENGGGTNVLVSMLMLFAVVTIWPLLRILAIFFKVSALKEPGKRFRDSEESPE